MGGGALYAPSSLFCLLLKISQDNSNLKILDLANLFVDDSPIKKKKKISESLSQSTLKYGSENNPWMRGIFVSDF